MSNKDLSPIYVIFLLPGDKIRERFNIREWTRRALSNRFTVIETLLFWLNQPGNDIIKISQQYRTEFYPSEIGFVNPLIIAITLLSMAHTWIRVLVLLKYSNSKLQVLSRSCFTNVESIRKSELPTVKIRSVISLHPGRSCISLNTIQLLLT